MSYRDRFALVFTLLGGLLVVAPAGARAQSKDEIARWWSLGEEAFAASRLDDARADFARVIDEDPHDLSAYVRLAQVQARLGEDPSRQDEMYRANLDLLTRALDLAPDSPLIKWQLGVVLWGHSAKAPKYLEEALAARPDLYDAAALLGHYYTERQEGTKAAAAFEDYLEQRPDSLAGQDTAMNVSLGRADLLAEDYDAALATLDALRTKEPDSIAVGLALGDAYARSGECDKGAPVLEEIIGQAKEHPQIIYDLAVCYLDTGRALAALKTARRDVVLLPDDASGHSLLGDIFRRVRDNNSALGEYERAYDLDPGNKEVGLRLAAEYRDVDLAERSLAVMERLVRAHPDDLEIQEGLATAYVAVGRIPDAMAIAEQVIGARPADARVQAFLGEVYYAANRLDDSIASFQKALQTTPGLTRAIDGLRAALAARARDELGSSDPATQDKAEGDLLTAQSYDVANPEIARDLAIYYLDRKNAEAAAANLAAAIKSFPDSFWLNYLSYRTELALGKEKEAGPYLEHALVAVSMRKDRVTGQPLAIAANELGALYVKAGKPGLGVKLFEIAQDQAENDDLQKLAARNLATAREELGAEELDDAAKRNRPERLEAGVRDLEGAVSDPAALGAEQNREYHCLLAVAYIEDGAAHSADALAALEAAGESCPLAAPYDQAGTGFLVALAQLEAGDESGRESDLRDGVKKAAALLQKPVEPVASALRKLLVPSEARLGYDLYVARKELAAGAALLREANQYRGPDERHPALDNDLAVLDFLGGGRAQAERIWQSLGADPAVALMNLGIAKEDDGDAVAAYGLYQRASSLKVKVPKEWTEYKRRIFGAELK